MSAIRISLSRAVLLCIPLLAAVAPGQDPGLEQRIDQILSRLERIESSLDALVDADAPGAVDSATAPEQRLAWYRQHAAMVQDPLHPELRWKHLGPTNISGRITDVAVETPRGKRYGIYVATASGGVWKTDNEGVTWKPVFEDAPTQSIGDVTLAPSDPQQVWIGTGEANIFRSSMAGCGVYKSTDGGATWQHMGLAATHTIARIVIHPTNPNVVYVAASGHEWTDNPERGVYRTVDGGEHWEQVLAVDPQTGAIDLAMDPARPEVLYAATWQRKRLRWNDPRNTADSHGSGVWRSTDGGNTWHQANEGLPAPPHRGRIGIDVSRSSPGTLYAFVDNYETIPLAEGESATDPYGQPRSGRIKGAEVYRSDDHARSWRKVSPSDQYMAGIGSTYGWVFGQIRVDPNDADTIYIMGLSLHVSKDGGQSFHPLRGMHGDHHGLWIDPDNSNYLVNNNDGGVNISYDGGAHWRLFSDNLPLVQFYNVGYDMAEPFHVYGSVQDHGSFKAEVKLGAIRGDQQGQRGRRGSGAAVAWERTSGGEASYHAVDPSDEDTLYSAGFYGRIGRTDQASGEQLRLNLETPAGERLRGQWLAPFLISPHNPRILYHGMNKLFRSMDRGTHFEAISPDLSHQRADQLGDIPYQTITTLAESPQRFGRLYVGTDDGRLHRTDDSGAHWQDISAGLAEERWISRVVASRWTEGVVYAAQNGKRWDDFTAYLWRSDDHGAHWRSIAAGLPGAPINVVREDPVNPDLLYVGSDLGVYVSADRGGSWRALGKGLPATVYAHDLIVHPRDGVLVVATHGRGMWALDVRSLQKVD